MLLLDCPYCGPRGHVEFAFAGEVPVADGPAPDPAAAVYERVNRRGRQHEYWQHLGGCRAWLVIERDTLTHEVFGVAPARPAPGSAP